MFSCYLSLLAIKTGDTLWLENLPSSFTLMGLEQGSHISSLPLCLKISTFSSRLSPSLDYLSLTAIELKAAVCLNYGL